MDLKFSPCHINANLATFVTNNPVYPTFSQNVNTLCTITPNMINDSFTSLNGQLCSCFVEHIKSFHLPKKYPIHFFPTHNPIMSFLYFLYNSVYDSLMTVIFYYYIIFLTYFISFILLISYITSLFKHLSPTTIHRLLFVIHWVT